MLGTCDADSTPPPSLPLPAGSQPQARSEGYGPPSPERIRRFRVFVVSWLLLSFLSIFAGEPAVAEQWRDPM